MIPVPKPSRDSSIDDNYQTSSLARFLQSCGEKNALRIIVLVHEKKKIIIRKRICPLNSLVQEKQELR